MWEEIIKAITLVYLPSTLKFIIGPLTGYAVGLHILTTIVCTIAGMMTTVVALTFFGDWIRNSIFKKLFHREPKPMEQRSKLMQYILKFEIGGIAFLTPIILTPIGGTILAISFGTPKEKIILYMFISATFFSILFSVLIYFFGNSALPEIVKPENQIIF